MDCSEVRDRLVAWRDGELGRSEAARVAEHVSGCRACRDLDQRLMATAPRPAAPRPPLAVRARLARDLDPDRLLALAGPPVASSAPSGSPRGLGPWREALRRPIPVPAGAAALYAAALAAAVAFGVAGWWSTPGAPPASLTGGAPGEIRADQFLPAAYDPADPRAPSAP